jgi:hypothetical protein
MDENSILVKTYELYKLLSRQLPHFPRDHKFLLGDRLLRHSGDLLERYIEAYYLPRGEKAPVLRAANIQLEKMRYFFRLCFELGLINSSRLKEWNEPLQDIGRMTGGWIKSLEAPE